ncbi:MAG TPA: ABC transporter ATP-binding protein [Tepidisphaeraceae bacterium]|jgi:ABC-2 type transport system ATP-binding protein|nr:ABC transporter ATP-binding protein [Tepidisphaeraceae bacterium]
MTNATLPALGTDSVPATAIDVRGLSKSFRRRPVLNDVQLSVPTGSVLGLLGKNAAGKTTFLKCLLGLIRPDAGAAILLGHSSWTLPPSIKASIGYVPQLVTHPAWMNIAQIVEYTASFYPRWNDHLVSRLLLEWELDESQKAGSLSLGTQQKLAIILALGHEPSLLILDEPAASLDPAARRDFLKALLDIAADGSRTILFSTHITSDLERVADSVAILQRGVIRYHGALDELKDSVKRLHITTPAPLTLPQLTIPNVLHTRLAGNTATITVQHLNPDLIPTLRRTLGATDIRTEDLNLEDIFLELHHD